MQTIFISTRLFSVNTMIAWSARYVFLIPSFRKTLQIEQMHGEKHIDRYPHRTSPMDKYKHEFKKSKSRLLLENTIPLSPCSFLVALFNIERSSILLRSDRTLSRLDDKRPHVLRTNVWQKLGGGCETVWHSART